MSPEEDCQGEAEPFVELLKQMYALDYNKKPDYNEVRTKLAIIILNKN